MPQIKAWSDVPGWFFWQDARMFEDILGAQTAPGTLVELGAYLGRSAVLMGHFRRDGEPFVVVDLFGLEPEDAANALENQTSYVARASEMRKTFEANYSAVHSELPLVVQGLSLEVAEHVKPGSVRFAHVDASHLYEHVAKDIDVMRDLMQPEGVIVFDDYRAAHTPGVAAAAWEAVATKGLIPFALSPHKMYATWGDPVPHRERTLRLGGTEPGMRVSEVSLLGHEVARLHKAKAQVKPAPDTEAMATPAPTQQQHAPKRSRSDWVPPVLAEWLRARRAR